MQASAQSFKAGAGPRAVASCAARRTVPAVHCQQGLPTAIKEAAKGATLAAATLGLVLGSGMPAQAAKPALSAFEERSAYEQELLEALKVRGKELPALTSSPEGSVSVEAAKAPALKLGPVEKVTIEANDAVPVPEPATTATAVAPAPTPAPGPSSAPAPVEVEAPKPAPAPVVPKAEPVPNAFGPGSSPAAVASAPVDANKGLIAGAAVATVAIAAVAVLGSQGNLEGAVASGSVVTAAPAAGGSAGVAPNVAEARAWIAAWKAKQGK